MKYKDKEVDTNEIIDIEVKEKTSGLYECSRNRKYFILFIISLNGFLGPLSSSIYAIRDTFQTSSTIINTTVSLYVFIQGIAPLGWATISEYYGRRIVYLTSSFLYILATIVCAISPNVGLFITFRILQSVGSSAPQAVGAGTITDLFEMKQRGNAMDVNWRYMFWLLTGIGGLVFLLILFFLPETRIKTATGNDSDKKNGNTIILQPFKHLLQPTVLCASIPLALAYGFMYFMIASLPYEMKNVYGLSSIAIGLAYLPNGLGNALGAVVSGIASDKLIKIITLCIGELIYGWCSEYRIILAVPMIGLFLLGLGVGFIQTPTNTFLVDAYSSSSASVISASNLLRCTCAGLTPLLAPTMISAIGNGWSMTILAALTLSSGICIILVQNME
ncbi:major facilitator superfamily domain-containing protein [Cunninghamella echinulata]|nr:major facilitator superfamily domain-containing protein [Cunninghamella echinulata]